MSNPDVTGNSSISIRGWLSDLTYNEVHAFVIGLGAGLATSLTHNPELAALVIAIAVGIRAAPTKRLKQLQVEPWYAIGGVVTGYLIPMIPL